MTTYKTVEHGDGSVTILDSDGNILDGNNRVQALMSMFRTEPTLVVSESPREYKVVDGVHRKAAWAALQDDDVIEMDDDLLSKLID